MWPEYRWGSFYSAEGYFPGHLISHGPGRLSGPSGLPKHGTAKAKLRRRSANKAAGRARRVTR